MDASQHADCQGNYKSEQLESEEIFQAPDGLLVVVQQSDRAPGYQLAPYIGAQSIDDAMIGLISCDVIETATREEMLATLHERGYARYTRRSEGRS
jgi:hypothetical protein